MSETKAISKIRKSAFIQRMIEEESLREIYLERANEGLKSYEKLFSEVEDLWKKEAIFFEDAELVLYPKLLILMKTDDAEKVKAESFKSKADEIKRKRLTIKCQDRNDRSG